MLHQDDIDRWLLSDRRQRYTVRRFMDRTVDRRVVGLDHGSGTPPRTPGAIHR
ncbi:hypothetical protein STRTUCAR8_00222 [Streptomyces turgidiscabies Car8]|uniref:Uncharacterized protein n=1 Tax=Streptomyces turgidiscabies (strain Car8) TaxID=698760 RepID=L7ETE5_STRT8|nr:hypothetical protein STRTUCAR8_00222 [Streptomyces turgidiscabies Car8]